MEKLTIDHISGLEILDSRGQPTIKAFLELSNGKRGEASVPAGASTGQFEARELRDGDPQRYRGLGCLQAVENINTVLRKALVGKAFTDQASWDRHLIELDNSPDKSNLGANTLLALSLAYARAMTRTHSQPLYGYFSGLLGTESTVQLPQLTVNLFSGGKHGGGQVPVQDVLVVPVTTNSIRESLERVFRIYSCVVDLM